MRMVFFMPLLSFSTHNWIIFSSSSFLSLYLSISLPVFHCSSFILFFSSFSLFFLFLFHCLFSVFFSLLFPQFLFLSLFFLVISFSRYVRGNPGFDICPMRGQGGQRHQITYMLHKGGRRNGFGLGHFTWGILVPWWWRVHFTNEEKKFTTMREILQVLRDERTGPKIP